MYIYDTHAHLDHLDDVAGSLQRAHVAEVKGIVSVSIDLKSCQKNWDIARASTQPKIYLAMGMHPSDARAAELPACIDFTRRHASDLVAIGEIGLDFWYKWARKDQQKKDEQRQVFRSLLELAKELNLPAIIHSRGTWRECLDTALEVGIKKAEFHWYSGPLDVLKDILAAGYYVSTSPSIAYAPPTREAMQLAPIEQTLIETDSPVMFKEEGREDTPFKAEPKDVWRTLKAYAALKQMDEAKALNILNQNAQRFFNLE
jgi:TatD DNase family protein